MSQCTQDLLTKSPGSIKYIFSIRKWRVDVNSFPSNPKTFLLFSMALFLNGCALFVSHYDAGAYQNFTNLKAFHIKFLEDNTNGPGKKFNAEKTAVTCDAGELKFSEATEYANGKNDETRVKAISYLHNIFKANCSMALQGEKLFSENYSKYQISETKKNYDLAIDGENIRIGNPSKKGE
jgi:hypothetical protein